MSLPKSILITGCNRGLGLGFVKEFLKVGNESTKIIATCRDKSKADELMTLESSNAGRLKVLELEVAKYENDYKDFVQEVENELGNKGLNLLINNAGISGVRQGWDTLTGDNMMDVFRVNVVGPTLLSRALHPFLKKASECSVVQMSSILGSIAKAETANVYAYRISKAALNMAMKNTAIQLGDDGIITIAMHPGWVRTDMGGPTGDISVEESVSSMVHTISQLGAKDNGAFLAYDGTTIPW